MNTNTAAPLDLTAFVAAKARLDALRPIVVVNPASRAAFERALRSLYNSRTTDLFSGPIAPLVRECAAVPPGAMVVLPPLSEVQP